MSVPPTSLPIVRGRGPVVTTTTPTSTSTFIISIIIIIGIIDPIRLASAVLVIVEQLAVQTGEPHQAREASHEVDVEAR